MNRHVICAVLCLAVFSASVGAGDAATAPVRVVPPARLNPKFIAQVGLVLQEFGLVRLIGATGKIPKLNAKTRTDILNVLVEQKLIPANTPGAGTPTHSDAFRVQMLYALQQYGFDFTPAGIVDTTTTIVGGGATPPGSVSSVELADNSVSTIDLADNAVTSPKIKDGEVATVDVADKAITAAKISSEVVSAGMVLTADGIGGAVWGTGGGGGLGGPAGGDLAGTYPNPIVAALQGSAVSATVPTVTGQMLRWNNATLQWEAALDANALINLNANNILGNVPIASGGTGAATAAGALTNLGAAASGANSDITSLTGLTTALSIAQGGTGSTVQNFVDLTTAQNVAGVKTFAASPVVPAPVAAGDAANKGYVDTLVGGFGGPFVQFAPAAAQLDSSTNSSIFINKANTGNMVQLRLAGADRFVIDNGGTITTGMWNGTAIGIGFGGTGATTAAAALTNLGAAASGINGDITELTGLTTALSITQGGTGSNVQNFVDLTTAQSIGGVKTFTAAPIVPAPVAAGEAANRGYVDGLIGGLGTGYVQLVPAAPQDVTSATAAISVNQLDTGDLLQLAIAGTDVFVIDNSGAVVNGIWNGSNIAANRGGTGINTSASTGVPSIAAGVWSVNATLPISLGGTGSATQNFVDLTTAQTVGGAKTFSATAAFPATAAQGNSFITSLNAATTALAVSAGGTGSTTQNFVDLTTAQTVGGAKTFSATAAFPATAAQGNSLMTPLALATSALPITAGGTGSTTQNFVDLTTGQTVGGAKIFTGTTTLPTTAAQGNALVSSINAATSAIAISAGGTGSTTQNFVDLTTAQSVGGAKTFTATAAFPATAAQGNSLITSLNAATSALSVSAGGTGSTTQNFVDLTTGQTVGGAKTFTATAAFPASAAQGNSLITSLNAATSALSVSAGGTGSTTQNFVDLTTVQNVAGVKTFTSSPVVPAPTAANQAANRGYVDGLISGLATGYVALAPAAAQDVASTTAAVSINQTDTGDLLQFALAGTDVFVIDNGGAVTTGVWNGTNIAPLRGGTGINTSASTGVPSIAAGVWSVNATLPISLGGTGSATQNFVDLATAQAVGGAKTFTATAAFPATAAQGNSLITSLNAATTALAVSAGGTGSTTQNFVDLTTAQTVGGVKTFSASPLVPVPTLAGQAASKGYVDGLVGGLGTGFVQLAPAAPQDVTSTTAAISINQLDTGDLLQLALAGADVFVIDNSGAVSTGVWNGTNIAPLRGGTGINTSASTGVPSIAAGTWSVNATLPISLGGTGSATQNFVDLTTAQTIGGAKTFSATAAFPATAAQGNSLITSLNAATSALAVSAGGTGSTTQNFVDLTTGQTVGGAKIFTGTATLPTTAAQGNALVSSINAASSAIAISAGGTGSTTQNFVDLTTAQSVGGAKTFTATTVVPVTAAQGNALMAPLALAGSALPISAGGTGSTTQNFVDLTTAQAVGGVKTFAASPVVPVPTLAGQAASKGYVDGLLGGFTGPFVALGATAAQDVASTTAAVSINQTDTGDLLQFALAGTDVFVIDNGGAVTTGVWNGSNIAPLRGGTGINTSASTGVPSIAAGAWSVNATLPISLGGTGSATQNFVDLTTAQSVGGVKTFTASPLVPVPTLAGQAASKGYVDGLLGGSSGPFVALGPAAAQDVTTTTAAISVNQLDTGDLLQLAVAGTDVFVIDNSGAVSAGIWNGSNIAPLRGGTGINTSASTGVPSIAAGTWSVNATLPVSLGGTGSATQNFVDLTTAQTVGGAKTFSATATFPATAAQGNSLITSLNAATTALAVSAGGTGSTTQNFVDLTTAQAVGGAKTFSATAVFPATAAQGNALINSLNAATSALSISAGGTGSTTQNFVDLSTNQTIGGNKTFGTTGLRINDAATDNTVAIAPAGDETANRTLNIPLLGANDTIVTLGTTQTMTGAKTFTATATFPATAAQGNSLITSLNAATTALAVSAGGTGSTTQNFVDLTTAQSVGGAKTFTATAAFPATAAQGNSLITSLNAATTALAVSAGGTGSTTQNFVDLTTAQSVGGAKTFTATAAFPATAAQGDALMTPLALATSALPISAGGTGSTTQNFVDLTTAQTLTGAKTFANTGLLVNDTAANNTVALVPAGNETANRTLSIPLLGANDTVVTLGTAQTITGAKTFANTGLLVNDTAANNTVALVPAGDETANRTLSIPLLGANDTLVTLAATQTLTNKTLTSPRIGTSILDTNGNTLFLLTATGAAVNHLTYANAAAATSPAFTATGADANIGMRFIQKADGAATFSSTTANSDAFVIKPQTTTATATFTGTLTSADLTANRTWTLPNVTSTMVVTSGTGVETLRVIRGRIDTTAGTILQGTGFTVVRNAAGDVTITFTTAFGGVPSVVCSAEDATGNSRHAQVTTGGLAAGSVQIERMNSNSNGGNADGIITFIAMGPP